MSLSRVRKIETIATEMKTDQQGLNPQLQGYGPMAVLGSINRSLAIQIQKLETLVWTANANLSIRTATGAALDALVIDRLPEGRLEGEKAGGFVVMGRYSPAPYQIVIAAGTRVSRPVVGGTSPTLYEVVEETIMEVGESSVVVNVQATEAGEASNAPAYSITGFIDPVPGIESIENPLPISGGEDPETDEELRRRYIYAILLPGRATPTMIVQRLLEIPGVTEAAVDTVGGGDISVIVDTAEGLFGDHDAIDAVLYDNIAAGITSRGVLTAQIKGEEDFVLDLGDSAGGRLYVRALGPIPGSEIIEADYLDVLGRERTATVVIPTATRRGAGFPMTMEESDDRATTVTEIRYEGTEAYDILVGLGEWPALFNLPESVNAIVYVEIRATQTAPATLEEDLQVSIRDYLNSYRIAEDLEYSDVFINAIATNWATKQLFDGIDEILVCRIVAKDQQISNIGQKITIDSDERIRSGAVQVTVI
ncbi:MAG TPA: baseplate J/gp47 family protein [Methanothrix sp.]|nr:baseplate J/gp47 family protein [Methanothrix sp.]